jgi:hypothetical protein
MKIRFLFLFGVGAMLILFLLGCTMGGGKLANITATPTKTPLPLFTSTMTPTATPLPSDTPVPTDTPIPPTDTPLPSETPLPPTDTSVPPTETSPLPSDTPPPTDTPAPPANTPKPKPTNTTAPPTNTPKPKVDFKVKEIVAFVDGSLTSTGMHNIYFTVIDAGGAPIDGIILQDTNNQPGEQVTTGNKGQGKTEFTMWAADYTFKVVGNVGGQTFSSETTHVLSVLYEHAVYDDLIRGGICSDEAACRAMGPIHYSYNVTFQRTW